ncbi:XVIPCD domain-containing protein [Xanthomonas sp. NCPPB 1754]|uniref:XVIPCD domain-containing protein n=1 Tax=Xanthomonas sp. NCPPB 1754 TaxID=487536 RepID=UPI003558A976
MEQLRSSIARLDESANKPWDERSDRMAASAYKMAVEAGFKPGDKVDVALNVPTDKLPGGVTMFVMRSGQERPRIRMPTALTCRPARHWRRLPNNSIWRRIRHATRKSKRDL